MSDLEWKIIYVGSAESEEYDQVLDSVLVGPVPAGRHMFVFQVSSLSKLLSYNTLHPVLLSKKIKVYQHMTVDYYSKLLRRN